MCHKYILTSMTCLRLGLLRCICRCAEDSEQESECASKRARAKMITRVSNVVKIIFTRPLTSRTSSGACCAKRLDFSIGVHHLDGSGSYVGTPQLIIIRLWIFSTHIIVSTSCVNTLCQILSKIALNINS